MGPKSFCLVAWYSWIRLNWTLTTKIKHTQKITGSSLILDLNKEDKLYEQNAHTQYAQIHQFSFDTDYCDWIQLFIWYFP